MVIDSNSICHILNFTFNIIILLVSYFLNILLYEILFYILFNNINLIIFYA